MILKPCSVNNKPVREDDSAEMAKYGIARVSIDVFFYKEYRYTNLEDAIAQAKRQHPVNRGDARRHLWP